MIAFGRTGRLSSGLMSLCLPSPSGTTPRVQDRRRCTSTESKFLRASLCDRTLLSRARRHTFRPLTSGFTNPCLRLSDNVRQSYVSIDVGLNGKSNQVRTCAREFTACFRRYATPCRVRFNRFYCILHVMFFQELLGLPIIC